MSTATTTVPPPQAKPRRRRWLRGMFALMALASLTFAGFWFYSDFAANKAWDDAEAEADRLDPLWRLEEIEADREVIPDDENMALVLAAIVREMEKKSIAPARGYGDVFFTYPPTARMNERQLTGVRFELSAVPKPLLEQMHQLHRLQKGRYSFEYTVDFYGKPFLELQRSRLAAHWLLHEAYLCAEEEKYLEAVKACHTVLNIGYALGFEPSYFSCATRSILQEESLYTLERILAQGQLSKESLEIMQIRIEKDIAESSWLTAMRGDRAVTHRLFTTLRQGTVKDLGQERMFGKKGPESVGDWIAYVAPSTVVKKYPEILHNWNGAIEVAKLPIHERLAKLQERDARQQSIHKTAARLIPSLQKLHRFETRSQCLLRSAQAALACERYRLRFDDWPATLDALVQAKLLAAVPHDPIDNQPLRYRKTKDGVVIYSIGADEQDNGGAIEPAIINGPNMDIGFRLWNSNRRRQPAFEAPEER